MKYVRDVFIGHVIELCEPTTDIDWVRLKADCADDAVPGLANPTKADPVLKWEPLTKSVSRTRWCS